MKKASWVIIAVLSSLVGIYPIIYFLIDRQFGLLGSKSEELLSNYLWNISFYGHIVFGGLALLIGWLQFSSKLRKNKIEIHRNIGRIYVISVLISGVCGLLIALYATGGVICILGFFTLGIIWLLTTILSLKAVKRGDIELHKNLMIFSYAACFAAVTLRIWLPILTNMMGEFIYAYRIVAWLSWVPNIIIAYLIVNKKKKVASSVFH
ncbi:DUF2306 domain-containing protein [Xanthovirga aplysinae]|uniref:DUF2306 domain-containing protein n=1 Tax=Xanthovirga aplysinae TaxID=2529853 RepID=UPI0012BB8E1B|nr:DUF2306 domain-containing protein [Xanthovirga aplysinae]MTI31244.1 DUF2306 domain-containing protein [Xanthovirga aplysinae]